MPCRALPFPSVISSEPRVSIVRTLAEGSRSTGLPLILAAQDGGARAGSSRWTLGTTLACPQIHRAVKFWRAKAQANRLRYEAWAYQYDWRSWMPDKWQRIGACETGYGKRPGDFHWNSGPYQGFAGFAVSSWDAFRLPGYPSEAYLATPRQQLNVALAIYARYGYSGWGCRGA